MKIVKITVAESDKRFNRQLPGGGIVWGDYEFHINDGIEEADYWVVCYQRLPGGKERCRVARENTLYVTWEPDSVWHFSKGFLRQFAHVISCQEQLQHPHLHKNQPGLSWYIGMRPNGGDFEYTMNYDQLKATHPEKSRLMSVITSNKAFTQGHRERLQFVEKLKAHFGDQLDLFGRGIRDFDDKWEVLAPYRYHICLENCAQPYYWSEKLADSLLAEAYPFYYGCTNLEQFFPEGGYKWIDIQDPERAIKIIEEAIAQDVATQEATALAEAKRLVLDEHNFFAMVAHHIDQHYTEAAHEEITIKDDLKFMDVRKVGMIWKRIKSK